MYKLEYIEHGIQQKITSGNIEPLQMLLRHLFALHNNYSGSSGEFELLFFGKVENEQELKKMNETNKNNSTSWWNNPSLAKQAADILDNTNPDDTVAVSYEDGKVVTETYSGESLGPAIEVAQLPAQPKKRGRPEKISKEPIQHS